MDPVFAKALTDYCRSIEANYCAHARLGLENAKPHQIAVREQMMADFKAYTEVGAKFVKVITTHGSIQRSVHSFVLIKDEPKAKAGSVFKAASWKAPTRNFTRGNIFDLTPRLTNWTGAT